jgi:hypothetical protein
MNVILSDQRERRISDAYIDAPEILRHATLLRVVVLLRMTNMLLCCTRTFQPQKHKIHKKFLSFCGEIKPRGAK